MRMDYLDIMAQLIMDSFAQNAPVPRVGINSLDSRIQGRQERHEHGSSLGVVKLALVAVAARMQPFLSVTMCLLTPLTFL